MSVLDFVGRTSDLLAFQGTFPLKRDQQVTMALARAGEGGFLTTGVQKIAQRFLVILLNKLGSLRYAPLIGTSFMIDADRGMWRTAADVRRSFYAAKLDFTRQMKSLETTDDPQDERLDTVNLIGIGMNAGHVTLRVRLTVLAGDQYVFVAPIATQTK